MLNQLASVHAARKTSAPPTIIIPAGCGFEGDQTVVVQVQVNYWETKVTGVTLNAAKGKWHRLQVTRWVPLADYNEAADTLLRTKCGKKNADRALRPTTRLDLVLPTAGPYGLARLNMAPWMDAMRQITEGLQWCIDAANSDKLAAFGLLMAIDIKEPKYMEPERYPAFYEAEVLGIRAAEVLQLEAGDDQPLIPIEAARTAAPQPRAATPTQPKQPVRRVKAASFGDE